MSEYQNPNSLKSLEVLNPKIQELKGQFAQGEVKPRAEESADGLKAKIIDVLKTIYDPELPVNIYDLGLIYDIAINAENRVEVKMTLTAPACPVAGTLPPEVERNIETIDEVKSARVELVWEPPWSRERMSEAALLELGLL